MSFKFPAIDPTDREDDRILYWDDTAKIHKYKDEEAGVGGATENLFIGSLDAMRWGTPSASTALTADRVYVAKCVPAKNVTVTTAYWQCGTSAGNMDIGIYNAALDSKLGSTGSFASPGTGARNQALASGVALTAGTVYYLAFVTDSTTLRIGTVIQTAALQNDGGWNVFGYETSAGIPLPASITATWTNGVTGPVFFLK